MKDYYILHEYKMLLPTVNEGFYHLQEEMDNVMIPSTTLDLKSIHWQSGLSSTNANLSTTAAQAGTAILNALAAINLANQKSWILLFQNL